MNETPSERRLAKNEVIFRQANRQIETSLKATVKEEAKDKIKSPDLMGIPLHFLCECSDDTCKARIKLTLERYKKLHKSSADFVIKPGHEIARIEKVTYRAKNYYVVSKYMQPPSRPTKLHPKDQNL